MANMDYFPFMDLPLVAQDLIVDKFIQSNEFKDRKQLLLTSTYCKWLVERAKPKQIHAARLAFGDEILVVQLASENILFQNPEEIAQFLKLVKFLSIDGLSHFIYYGFFSPLKDLWINAMEFLKEIFLIIGPDTFDFYMEILPKLPLIQSAILCDFDTKEHFFQVMDCFQRFPIVRSSAQGMDDEVLKYIASKSDALNPLEELLFSQYGTTVDGIESFLKTATFANNALITVEFEMEVAEFEQMLGKVGQFEKNVISNDIFTKYDLKSGIKVVETSNNHSEIQSVGIRANFYKLTENFDIFLNMDDWL
uniref:F-box domain-containing protein n=1 Tax=Panagrolaimus sp. JU765 TaxID=591449 RepID=A0AC34PWQ3_9BILA